MESVVHEGGQVTKPTPLPPPTSTERDSGASVSGFEGAHGGRIQTYRIMGVAQKAVSEEATTLMKDKTGLTVDAEVGRRLKKLIRGMGGKEIFVRTGH